LSKANTLIDEHQLVAWLHNRNQQVMSVLYDRYSAALFGVIKKVVTDEAAAEDLLQEVFLKIWRAGTQYNADKGRLFTWMMQVARNAAIDHIRSKRHRESIQTDELDVHTVVNEQVSTPVDHIGLKEVVATLKPEQQEVLDLLYFGGLTQEQAAEELGIPLGTVKTRARTAVQQLRKLLIEKSP
jgi:RNA polymerase sigma-70 factor (ECF subfamily)